MPFNTLWAVAIVAGLAASCAHTESEERKDNYQDHADDRIDDMEDNVKKLEARSKELMGEPKSELESAIDALESKVSTARAELDELQDRDTDTWVDKKNSVDQSLFEMDTAYSKALGLATAH